MNKIGIFNQTNEEVNTEAVEKTTEVSDADSEYNYEKEQASIEGTLPAIELPK